MMICAHLVVLFFLVVGVHSQTKNGDAKSPFNYDPRGAAGVYQWQHNYLTCSGERQSPVDISTQNVRYVQHKCPSVQYGARVLPGTLENTGLFAKFTPSVTGSVRMTNVPFSDKDTYVFKNLHAHHGGVLNRGDSKRGPNSSILYSGAEHLIDGHRFDGEVHMVFYNSKFKDIKEASQYKDGLAVIGVFVEVVPDNLLTDQRFSMFLENNLPRVTSLSFKASAKLDIGMFLERECSFYTYDGSLTTPHCNESVQWIVLRKTIQVSRSAWTHYGTIESHGNHNEIYGNYRNTMPLNKRVVTTNFIPGNPQSYVTRRLLQPKPTRNMPPLSLLQSQQMAAATRMVTNPPTKAYLAPFGSTRSQTSLTRTPHDKASLGRPLQHPISQSILPKTNVRTQKASSSLIKTRNRPNSMRQIRPPRINSFTQTRQGIPNSLRQNEPRRTAHKRQPKPFVQNRPPSQNTLTQNRSPVPTQTNQFRPNTLTQSRQFIQPSLTQNLAQQRKVTNVPRISQSQPLNSRKQIPRQSRKQNFPPKPAKINRHASKHFTKRPVQATNGRNMQHQQQHKTPMGGGLIDPQRRGGGLIDPQRRGGGLIDQQRRGGGLIDPHRRGVGLIDPQRRGGGLIDPHRRGGGLIDPQKRGGGLIDPQRRGGGLIDPQRRGGGLIDPQRRGGGLIDPQVTRGRPLELQTQRRDKRPGNNRKDTSTARRPPVQNQPFSRRTPPTDILGNIGLAMSLANTKQNVISAHQALIAEGEYLISPDVPMGASYSQKQQAGRFHGQPLGPNGRPLTQEEISELTEI